MDELKTIDTGIDCNVIESMDSVQDLLDKYGRPNPSYSPEKTPTGLTVNYAYNVLQWPGMEFLEDYIRQGYEEFTGIKGTPLYVQCWVNILTRGQRISPHTHAIRYPSHYDPPISPTHAVEDFVSGHFHVKVNESSFNYYGDENEPVMNKNGMLTIFSPYVSHHTDVVVDDERISFAFDIISEDLFNRYPELINWVKI